MIRKSPEIDAETLRGLLLEEIEKEPAPVEASTYQTVKTLLPEIDALLKRRRSRKEVVDLLGSKGLVMSMATFNTYYSRAVREAREERGETVSRTPRRRKSGSKPEKVATGTKMRPVTPVVPAEVPTGTEVKRHPAMGHRLDDSEV